MRYRRLWLLLSVALFAIAAPMVVFWTAGYRWNPKKGAVERNGTLIVDTQPIGVRAILNGERLENESPFTRQDITPGTYHIRLEREGYHAWEKTLDVRPERVTFVTDVWLWRQSEPTLFRETQLMGIVGSPDGREIAVVERVGVTPQVTVLPAPGSVFASQEATRTFQGRAPTGTVRMTWNESGTGLLLEDDAEGAWVTGTSDRTGVATLLPQGVYRWDGSTLVGSVGGDRFSYALADGVVRRVTLPEGVVDEDGGFQVFAESSGVLSVVERGREARQFELPPGNWAFSGREEGWLLLWANDPVYRWLAFDPRSDETSLASVGLPAKTVPRTTRLEDELVFLSFDDNELWTAQLGQEAELLARTSDLLVDAIWHPRAPAVFYATTHDVVAMGLDARDGREQVTLATFDRILGVAIANRVMYVAGDKGGVQGIWAIAIE